MQTISPGLRSNAPTIGRAGPQPLVLEEGTETITGTRGGGGAGEGGGGRGRGEGV